MGDRKKEAMQELKKEHEGRKKGERGRKTELGEGREGQEYIQRKRYKKRGGRCRRMGQEGRK